MVTYAADSHTLYGELYYRPAADYPAGTLMDIIEWVGGNKGANSTSCSYYSVVGNINEHQLAISETTYGGLLFRSQRIIDYGSLIYITLKSKKCS